MIDYKAFVSKHGPMLATGAVGALIAALVLKPSTPPALSTTAPSTTSSIPSFVEPNMSRCTGLDSGDEHSGVISVYELGYEGCYFRFPKPFDHDPTCKVELLGAIDTDHRFLMMDTSVRATKERIVIPGARSRMKFRYICT